MRTYNKLATVPKGGRWLHRQKIGCGGNCKHNPTANRVPQFEIFHLVLIISACQRHIFWQFGYKGTKFCLHIQIKSTILTHLAEKNGIKRQISFICLHI